MTRTLDLSALRSFVAIVEAGGVTRAAGRLNLTQSAVSMQLKRLEETLGQTLLERKARGMAPTAHGEQLFSYARRMLELNEEVFARMTDRQYEGTLSLGVPHDIVYPHVPEVLKAFARTHPRVKVTLQSSYTHELKEQFARGELDVILTTEQRPDGGAEILQQSPLVWVGAPGGVAWRERPLPLAFEHSCIFRPWVQRALDEAGIAWAMVVESMSIRTIDASVAADLAVHTAIAHAVAPQLAPIDHGGALPPLPTTSIAMYATDGPNYALADKLADVLRDKWTIDAAERRLAAE